MIRAHLGCEPYSGAPPHSVIVVVEREQRSLPLAEVRRDTLGDAFRVASELCGIRGLIGLVSGPKVEMLQSPRGWDQTVRVVISMDRVPHITDADMSVALAIVLNSGLGIVRS